MAEKMSEVYEKYEVDILQTVRGRGAIMLKTNDGIYQLKTPEVSENRLVAEYEFKEKMCDKGFVDIDRCIKNIDGELATFDRYGNPFVLRKYFEGKECNIYNRDEILLAVENLANLHIVCEQIFRELEGDVRVRLNSDFRKRNQEMKRVYNFIQKKKRKNNFEDLYKKAYAVFYEQAVDCEQKFGKLNIENSKRHLGYCHGVYDYHSLIRLEEDNEIKFATVNFERFYVGNQLGDLYHFMRKVVEKNNYDFELLKNILTKYSELNKLTIEDVEYIYVLFKYPEKYYKIGNQYMNSAKTQISPKMKEKLDKVISDEEKKQSMLEKFYLYKNSRKFI